jgi:carbamoyltransferase
MNILGISCFYHDAAAALVRDGVLVAAAEEERFTRRKHDAGYPGQAIAFCLAQAGIAARDLDYVVFYEKPFLKFERILLTCLGTFPRSARLFREAMVTWLGDKLWIRSLLRTRLGVEPRQILFSEHHLSHAASAFYCSPFEEAAVLTVDGVGEWTTASYGVGRGSDLTLLEEIRFPHSLGLLYSAFTAFLGFEVNEGEYKVMGMAPYGRPRYVDEVRRLVRVGADGSFALDLDYFSFPYSTERLYNDRFVARFGAPRDPRLHFFTPDSGYPSYFGDRPPDFDRLAQQNQHYADLAASVQVVTEEAMLAMARHLRQRTGLHKLCLAGGCALNSVANGRLLREAGFDECFVQPAAGDSGGAAGAALWAYHGVLGKPRTYAMEHAYLGREWSPAETRDFFRAQGIRHEEMPTEDALLDRTVGLLASGGVVGWHQGRFEWGPRALGNRSILADPRRAAMKDIVNVKIKFREPYRPFAPSVVAERTEDYFELPDAKRHYPARFMLYVTAVHQDQRATLPAITHVDGSARLQTVFEAWSPLYHHLITRFGAATGVPVLLNTSFNLKGEPIVASPADAHRTFMASGMDALVVGPFIVRKEDT